MNELVQSSRDSHEHESHHHGAIEDIDFKFVRDEETKDKGIFNGKGLIVSPYAYFFYLTNFVKLYIQSFQIFLTNIKTTNICTKPFSLGR